MDEPKIISSRNDFEAFKESTIWADIVNELNGWKEGFAIERDTIVERAALDNPSTANVLLHLGDLNGRVKAVNYLLTLPDTLMGVIEGQQETTDNQEETNDE